MKKIKSFISILFIFLILIIYFTTIVYSTSQEYITITTENLKNAYSSFLSKSNDSHFYAEVTDSAINIHSDDVMTPLNYTLGQNTTFTTTATITHNMTYEEYSKEISKTILPLYGFLGVATVQKVNLSDSFTYIATDLLSSEIINIPNFSSSMLSFSSNSYTQDSSGNITTQTQPDNFNAFEMAKSYSTPIILNDSDEFGLYEWEVKQASTNDEKLIIISTLTVKNSNNYIKLDKYNKLYADSLQITNNSISLNKTDINIQTKNNTISNTASTINNNINNTITKLPNAGININLINIIKIILIIATISIILFTIYNISQKNN